MSLRLIEQARRFLCVEENPEALVTDFVSVLETSFQRRGIQLSILSLVHARRGWDVAPSRARRQSTRPVILWAKEISRV